MVYITFNQVTFIQFLEILYNSKSEYLCVILEVSGKLNERGVFPYVYGKIYFIDTILCQCLHLKYNILLLFFTIF